MLAEVLESRVEFLDRLFVKPLKLSSGTITKITEARVEVSVSLDGRRGSGRGTIYLSDLWAWPDNRVSHETRDHALRDLCRHIAAGLRALCGGESAHPLEL